MPKRIVKGVGMMKYEVLVYGPGPMEKAEAESFMEAMRRFSEAPVGDERRKAIAQRCREFLARAGLGDMMITSYAIDEEKLRSRGLAENSAQWLSACWLRTFYRLQDEVTRINAGQGDVSLLISIAEELGRIEDRAFWRAGVDPQTNEVIEKLALERQHSRKKFAEVSEGRSAANAKRHEEATILADIAQGIADEYWRRHPKATKSEVAKHVVKKWPGKGTCGLNAPRENTVRQKISKP